MYYMPFFRTTFCLIQHFLGQLIANEATFPLL